MSKENAEFQKWHQPGTPAAESSTLARFGQVLSEAHIGWTTMVRCGQFLGAVLLARGFTSLAFWSGDSLRLLAALAATSALLYIGLAVQSRNGFQGLLNLLALPILFATAYAGLQVAVEWLILSFVLHGILTAVQLASAPKDMRGGMFCWSVFNSVMALFLLLR